MVPTRSWPVPVVRSRMLSLSAGVAAVYRAWGYVWLDTVRIEDWTTLVLRRPG